MSFHVVCHDCDFELLQDHQSNARAFTGKHRDDTGHNVEYSQVATDGGEQSGSGTAHPDPQKDPTLCTKCGTYIGMWSDDYCDGCAREIGVKEPIVRCVGCGQEGPADRMDTIDVSPEDDYYPEIEYLCPSCSGGAHDGA